MPSFPERLRKLRTERGWSQEELGRRVHVTKVSISGYENDNRNPDTETLQRLADIFEVSVDYLLGRTEVRQSGGVIPDDQAEFLRWVEENLEDSFFYDFHKSPEEQKEDMMDTLRLLWERDKKRLQREKEKGE